MKVNKIFALAALISIASASSVFAAAITVDNSASPGGDLVIAGTPNVTIKPSKNVIIKYIIGDVVTGGHASYAIQSHHIAGTKTYSSSSGDTKIYMANDNSTTGITVTVAAPAVGSTMTGGGTAM